MAAPPRQLVLGTAGHIDHGKTTLVHALTGVDTDRLPEEQRRGITIELGFAAFELSASIHVAVVDVPGHEGLVRTMIAGAGGIDLVLLAISAEDGVMPQTREHLHICELLGLRHGVVALTKIDRLGDEELLALASEDVRSALAGTALADAPVIPVSARTGEGLDRLRAALLTVARKLPERGRRGEPILPIDRVFTLRGQGTVVTGTLVAGTLDPKHGDELEWRAQGVGRNTRPLRVRGLHSQGRAVERAHAGMRVAVALANVAVEDLARGDVLTRGQRVVESRRVLVRVHQLDFGPQTQPWTRRSVLQVCVGTAHTAGRMVPLAVERDDGSLVAARELGPGETGLARIYLDSAVPVWSGQRLILRAFTAAHAQREGLTIGGGTIVDPLPGRGQPERRIALARTLLDPDPRARMLGLIRDAGLAGIDELELTRRTGIEQVGEQLGGLPDTARILALGAGRWADASLLDPLIERAIAEVDRFHASQPLQAGMPRATLERSLGADVLASRVLALALERRLLRVADRSGSLARPQHAVLDPEDLPAPLPAILDRYVQAELTPPTLRELADGLGLELRAVLELASLLHRHELLVRVNDEISYAPAPHARILVAVREHLREHGSLDVQALKLRLGLSRKFAVPLLEHLDRLGITRRQGDVRVPGRAAAIGD